MTWLTLSQQDRLSALDARIERLIVQAATRERAAAYEAARGALAFVKAFSFSKVARRGTSVVLYKATSGANVGRCGIKAASRICRSSANLTQSRQAVR